MLDSGFWINAMGAMKAILDAGFWMIDFGFWILDFDLDTTFAARSGRYLARPVFLPTDSDDALSATLCIVNRPSWIGRCEVCG